MRAFAMTIFTWTAAFAACHAGQPAAFGRLTSSGAEFSIRDKSWTTGCLGARGVSQGGERKAVTTRRSFAAEGTGLEPATGCPAPHFQCGR